MHLITLFTCDDPLNSNHTKPESTGHKNTVFIENLRGPREINQQYHIAYFMADGRSVQKLTSLESQGIARIFLGNPSIFLGNPRIFLGNPRIS